MYGVMLLSSLLSSYISFPSPSNGLLQARNRPSLTIPSLPHVNYTEASAANGNPIPWPPAPFTVPLLRRKGKQFILITRNDRIDYGPSASNLATKVCTDMTTWIRTLTHGVPITDPHWETESYGEHFATEFTVAMQLVPWHADPPDASIKLDRELMYSAMVEFCRMVDFYGALQGEWEYWAWARRLAVVKVHVWQWPKESKAEVLTTA